MTDFTGDPIWRDTIVGPSPNVPATAEQVTDMGVLLADRTMFLYTHLGETSLVKEVGLAAIPLTPGALGGAIATITTSVGWASIAGTEIDLGELQEDDIVIVNAAIHVLVEDARGSIRVQGTDELTGIGNMWAYSNHDVVDLIRCVSFTSRGVCSATQNYVVELAGNVESPGEMTVFSPWRIQALIYRPVTP